MLKTFCFSCLTFCLSCHRRLSMGVVLDGCSRIQPQNLFYKYLTEYSTMFYLKMKANISWYNTEWYGDIPPPQMTMYLYLSCLVTVSKHCWECSNLAWRVTCMSGSIAVLDNSHFLLISWEGCKLGLISNVIPAIFKFIMFMLLKEIQKNCVICVYCNTVLTFP